MLRLNRLSTLVVALATVLSTVCTIPAAQPPQPPWFDSRFSEPVYQHQQHSMPQHRPQEPYRIPVVAEDPHRQYSMPQHQPQGPPGVRVSHLFPTPPLVGTSEAGAPRRFPPAAPAGTETTTVAFKPGEIIAWIGDQPIQAGDLLPMVERTLAPYLEKMPADALESEKHAIDDQRRELLKQALKSAIDTKLLYLDFLRTIPSDKRDELLPNITARAENAFYEEELPKAIGRANVASARELEADLRKYGSSLAAQKRSFVERVLARSMLGQKVDYQPEVTHMEMVDYWHENEAEFDRPAKVRWEKITVRFDQFPTKEEAWVALGNMGNEVLRGAPFAAVARRHSQGVDADDGGYHDWTTIGSLASDVLDQAVFRLPIGQLSERMEDERGFHIVRVIERDNGGPVPFLDAQGEIQQKLRKQNVRKQVNEYVARLRKEIHVWTVFDQES